MAEFRQIHTRIWKDEWFSELPTDARLLFIYLFSNEQASVCGMYELPMKFMAFETGLSAERITEILQMFETQKKVYYRDGVVWVVNLRKYNETPSPKVYGRIVKDIEGIPDGWVKERYCKFYSIPYRYPIDTHPTAPDTHSENDSETETFLRDRDRDETPEDTLLPVSSSPEIELYREVTNGLIPDYSSEQTIIQKIQAIRGRLKFPPREQLKEYLSLKYTQWCNYTTADGRPYSPMNPGWLDWCITDYTPPPRIQQPAKRKRILTGANGEQIEEEE